MSVEMCQDLNCNVGLQRLFSAMISLSRVSAVVNGP